MPLQLSPSTLAIQENVPRYVYVSMYKTICIQSPAERIYVYNSLSSSSAVRSLSINVTFGQEAEHLFDVITAFSFTIDTKHEIHPSLNS